MARIRFTQNIQRHVSCPDGEVSASTLREALEAYFATHAQARGYVLDDHGRLRQHMALFIDGRQMVNRDDLNQPIPPQAIVDVMQALSGG